MSSLLPVAVGLALGIALISCMALFFPHVSTDAESVEKIWVAYSPIQCKDERWGSMDFSKVPEQYNSGHLGSAYAAAKYHRGSGITVYDFAATQGGIVPHMCGHPAGYQILLLVPKAQTTKMTFSGFVVHSGPAAGDSLASATKTQDVASVPNTDYSGPSASGNQSELPDDFDIVSANNQFAIKLYQHLGSKDGENNIFFSPWGMSSAFSLVYEGARGETAEEIQSLFLFPPEAEVRKSSIMETQSSLNQKDVPYEFHTANALWLQEGFQVLDEFSDTAVTTYDSNVASVDFKVPQGIDTINQWVSNQTNNKIPQLFTPGTRPEAVFAITNAVYFKGTWYYEFEQQSTTEEAFRVNNSTIINVPMMYARWYLNYGESSELQILELPYKGERISMLVLLPKNDDLDALEKKLSPTMLHEWNQTMQQHPVNVHIPRFALETDYDLKKEFTELGLVVPFSEKANFTGITPKSVLIGEAVHKAYVEVSEKGTEAAAATGAIGYLTGGPAPVPKDFNADHPFIFIIRDNYNGNILFFGRVVNPAVS